MYRQTVTIEELDDHGGARGNYREIRDMIFSPQHERSEEMIGKPQNDLKNLILTDEDFRDIRDIQPMVLTEDRLWNYETKFRGEETMDDVDCWVLQVRPRQILSGQRFFDGMIWVDKKEYNIVRMEGQAVPQIRTTKTENLFPRFTTHSQGDRRQALVSDVHLRRRHPAIQDRAAARASAHRLQQLQAFRGGIHVHSQAMKKSTKVTLTVVAAMGLTRLPPPRGSLRTTYFDAQACQNAVRSGGYYWRGSWYPMVYHYPYPYYYDSYRSYVQRGGTVRPAPSGPMSHPSAGAPSSVPRGGFGSTGAGHSSGG